MMTSGRGLIHATRRPKVILVFDDFRQLLRSIGDDVTERRRRRLVGRICSVRGSIPRQISAASKHSTIRNLVMLRSLEAARRVRNRVETKSLGVVAQHDRRKGARRQTVTPCC